MESAFLSSLQLPANLADFQRIYSSEIACERALFVSRWPNGYVCPTCGSRKYYCRKTRRTIVCRRCRRQLDLTSGTLLQHTHLPLSKWFHGIYLMVSTTGGLSLVRFGSALGIRRIETLLHMQQRIRLAMARADSDPLEGVVILCEKSLSKDKVLSRIDNGWLVGAFEVRGNKVGGAESGRMRLAYLKRASAKALRSFVTASITPGAVVVSDDHPKYAELDLEDYVHVPYLARSTSTMANFRNIAKWELAAVELELAHVHRGRMEPGSLQRYLDEISFRHNFRNQPRGVSFQAVLSAIARPIENNIRL